MSEKHTPGPWSIDPRVSTRVVAAADRGICSTAGYYRNTIDPVLLDAENGANARLIASAPALLEALELTQEYLREMRNPCPDPIYRKSLRDRMEPKVDAALAAARDGREGM